MAISIDFQGTYGVTEQKEAQDLGVMGTLDNEQRPDAMIPAEGDVGNDALSQPQSATTDQLKTIRPMLLNPVLKRRSKVSRRSNRLMKIKAVTSK